MSSSLDALLLGGYQTIVQVFGLRGVLILDVLSLDGTCLDDLPLRGCLHAGVFSACVTTHRYSTLLLLLHLLDLCKVSNRLLRLIRSS